MKNTEPLTGLSEMPTGVHKGKLMHTVPAEYLLWLYDNNRCTADVRQYIETYKKVLEAKISRKFTAYLDARAISSRQSSGRRAYQR